jgi:hypothetical protein
MTAWWLVMMGAACGIFCVGWLAKKRIEQIAEHRKHRDAFYDAAGILVGDKNTPNSIVAILVAMSDDIRSKTVLWRMLWRAVTGQLRDFSQCPNEATRNLEKDMRQLPQYLQEELGKAIVAFVFSIANNNVILGPLVLRVMLFAVSPNKKERPYSVENVRPLVEDIAERKLVACL